MSNDILVVNILFDEISENQYLDKTWQEIHDAFINYKLCVAFLLTDSGSTLSLINSYLHYSELLDESPEYYEVRTVDGVIFRSETADGILAFYEE